ncbi:MAG: insulinase family protein [Proteobacteria bacterium]|nr:insulinase family protein [Pseudomonadota bacterium]
METIKIEKLPHGFTVASDYMPSVETVTVSFIAKAGSRHEEKEINGISHFLEHMAFKGTKTRSARQIAEEFDMIGGYFNAYTARDLTKYYAKVMKENWLQALDIIADIIQNSTYVEQELEKERGVILQELAQTIDTPDDIVFDYFQEEAYHDQPIGRSILGTQEFIKRVTRDDLQRYVNKHYGFNNCILAAAGNIDHHEFAIAARDKFQQLIHRVDSVPEPARYGGGDRRVQRDLEQVHLVLGIPGLSYLDEDYYTQTVLAVIAGGGMSSRLFQEVREKRGLAYSISAFTSSYSDTGMFSVYSGTNENHANELLDVVIEQLHELTRDITEEELQRAKVQVRAGLLMSQESSISRAERLGSNLAAYNRYIPIKEIIGKIERIERRDVCKMMQRLLHGKHKPTIASIGKVDKLYHYDDIAHKLKA